MPQQPIHSRGIIAPGERLVQVVSDCTFTEGPTADEDGNVFFTDQPNDRIIRIGIDGTISTFMSPCGRSNGMFFSRGRLYACADEKNELWAIDVATKHVEILVTGYEGARLNGPNDVWVHSTIGLYFSDPFFERDYWSRGPMEQNGEHVYFRSADGKRLVRVTNDLQKPNGLVGTADGRTLYIADAGAGRTYSYTICADGSLSNKQLFCEMGSDGMTIDVAGNLYLTGGDGVTVFDRNGERIDQISIPGQGWTSNVCFGGPALQTLFITAGSGVYSIRTRFVGVAPG